MVTWDTASGFCHKIKTQSMNWCMINLNWLTKQLQGESNMADSSMLWGYLDMDMLYLYNGDHFLTCSTMHLCQLLWTSNDKPCGDGKISAANFPALCQCPGDGENTLLIGNAHTLWECPQEFEEAVGLKNHLEKLTRQFNWDWYLSFLDGLQVCHPRWHWLWHW